METVLTLLYEFGIRLLVAGIRIAALFNTKARKWVEGRRNWRVRVNPTPNPSPAAGGRGVSARAAPYGETPLPPAAGEGLGVGLKTLWVHAASLGEFEQGRPVIEAFREQFPDWHIVLTFFSPSGYEIRKNYPYADLVCYMPADTRRNARDFLDSVRPDAAIFVKYDYWANHLFELKKRGIPTLLISASFRDTQPFFRWYGSFWRKMLGCFTHFFVQNETSANLLNRIDFQNITVAGDTRVDRVLKIAEGVGENAITAAFCPPGEHVFIAGSSWEADEAIFFPVFQKPEFQNDKIIVAPHDPSDTNVQRICSQADNAVRYSEYQRLRPAPNDARILVIDNVGLLNTLYRYGKVAYIGGGFGKGIHNTLEPAAFGLPVIFGPKYGKFEEAQQFVARGGAFAVHNSEELAIVVKKLQNPDFYKNASQAVRGYLEENKGATDRILSFLKQILTENP